MIVFLSVILLELIVLGCIVIRILELLLQFRAVAEVPTPGQVPAPSSQNTPQEDDDIPSDEEEDNVDEEPDVNNLVPLAVKKRVVRSLKGRGSLDSGFETRQESLEDENLLTSVEYPVKKKASLNEEWTIISHPQVEEGESENYAVPFEDCGGAARPNLSTSARGHPVMQTTDAAGGLVDLPALNPVPENQNGLENEAVRRSSLHPLVDYLASNGFHMADGDVHRATCYFCGYQTEVIREDLIRHDSNRIWRCPHLFTTYREYIDMG